MALLGSINVGERRLTNEELVDACARLNLTDPTAYQAAGNVVFDDDRDEAALTSLIEDGLRDALGYEVTTFLRTMAQLGAVAGVEAFPVDVVAASGGAPQVAFLRTAPPADSEDSIAELSTDDDRLVLVGREVHWLPEHGVGRSKLSMPALRRVVGPMTVRTHATVGRLVSRFA